MKRRSVLFAGLGLVPYLLRAEMPKMSIRGRLDQAHEGKPELETPEHKHIHLAGDEPTMRVLNDKRLAGADLEALGKLTGPEHFTIDPIHTRAMFVHKDGKRLMISYWCDVCYIRTYSPGKCWCCQAETALDLREPDSQ